MAEQKVPRVFISYSWDDDQHKIWVRDLATKLRGDGIDVTLDQWHVRLGEQVPAFMERAVRENDFVLIICTIKYKRKSEGRIGGVGYEGDIIQGEVFLKSNHTKFIPIIKDGTWQQVAPDQLLGKAYLSLAPGDRYEENYHALIRTLHGRSLEIPQIGRIPVSDEHLSSWNEAGVFTGHSASVKFVAITSDGGRAASMSNSLFLAKDKSFRVWDTQSGKQLSNYVLGMDSDYRRRYLYGFAMNSDGRIAVASGQIAEIFYLEKSPVIKGGLSGQFTGEPETAPLNIYAVALPTDGSFVLGAESLQLRIWDSETRLTKKIIPLPRSEYSGYGVSLALDGDGNTALFNFKKSIGVIDLKTGRKTTSLLGHGKDVNCVALSDDGSVAVSGSGDKTVKVWDVQNRGERCTLAGHAKSVDKVAISATGDVVVSGSSDETVKVWDLVSGLNWTLNAYGYVYSLAATPDASVIVAGTSNNEVRIWRRN